jgi:hypothetical protein
MIEFQTQGEDYTLTPKDCKLIRNCVKCGRPITRNFTEICYYCEIRDK